MKAEDDTGEWQFQKLSKWLFIHLIPVPGHAQSIQTGPGTSPCSSSGLYLPSRPHFLFLQPIPKQNQESVSAPCPCCPCQAGASSWSVGTIKTQNCYSVTPDPGLVNHDYFMEASQSAGALYYNPQLYLWTKNYNPQLKFLTIHNNKTTIMIVNDPKLWPLFFFLQLKIMTYNHYSRWSLFTANNPNFGSTKITTHNCNFGLSKWTSVLYMVVESKFGHPNLCSTSVVLNNLKSHQQLYSLYLCICPNRQLHTLEMTKCK